MVLTATEAMTSGRPVAWFAPTYKMLADVWRQMCETLRPLTVSSNATEHRIELVNGGAIEMWSLDSADAGRGRRYARVVVDEAAMVPMLVDTWQAAIRPTLTDYRGDAWFMSTPKGRNGFWQLWTNGQDLAQPDWQSWQMPTATNPFISPDEIDAARAMLPDMVFRQEYLAEFAEDSSVFRHIRDCATATEQAGPIPGHEYVIGCDWGKLNDFTVFVVMDRTTESVAHIDRMNMVDYVLQADRLKLLADKWQPTDIVTEDVGVGDPVADMLWHRELSIRRFKTQRASKQRVIEQLIRAFDERAIKILDDPTLIAELQVMEAQPTERGFRYSAPAGYHDDCVMALAFAWDAARVVHGFKQVSRRVIA